MKSGTLGSKIIALLLLALAVGMVYALVAVPLLAHYNKQKARISVLATRAAMISMQSELAPELQRTLAQIQTGATGQAPFWPGATNAAITAGLVERINALLVQESARIGSTEILPSDKTTNLQTIGIKIRFEADIEQVQHIVHGVETMSPPLLIKRLAIRSLNATSKNAQPLAIEMEAYGLAEPIIVAGPLS